jgi:hypothetical protein
VTGRQVTGKDSLQRVVLPLTGAICLVGSAELILLLLLLLLLL